MPNIIELSPETLGQRLVYARERANLSTAQAARRLGVKTRTLSRWERDEIEPRPNRLVTLAQMLNVSPAWLLQGSERLEPAAIEPDLASVQSQLQSAKLALQELTGIVEDLTALVSRKMAESHRDAA